MYGPMVDAVERPFSPHLVGVMRLWVRNCRNGILASGDFAHRSLPYFMNGGPSPTTTAQTDRAYPRAQHYPPFRCSMLVKTAPVGGVRIETGALKGEYLRTTHLVQLCCKRILIASSLRPSTQRYSTRSFAIRSPSYLYA